MGSESQKAWGNMATLLFFGFGLQGRRELTLANWFKCKRECTSSQNPWKGKHSGYGKSRDEAGHQKSWKQGFFLSLNPTSLYFRFTLCCYRMAPNTQGKFHTRQGMTHFLHSVINNLREKLWLAHLGSAALPGDQSVIARKHAVRENCSDSMWISYTEFYTMEYVLLS